MSNEGIERRGIIFKILVLWFAIIVLASFAASLQTRQDKVGIQVLPVMPKEGQPILVTFSLNNPSNIEDVNDYSLYANGQPVMSGSANLAPDTGRQFQYTYSDPLKTGEQVTFLVKSQSNSGGSEQSLSVPAYAPTVWSSFVSFAAFSTTMLSSTGSNSINSMSYYDKSFVSNNALNVGLILSIVLIILLIYMELSEPLAKKSARSLRTRFGWLSGVLFIIFVGMVLTQIALILGGVR